jgi:ComF family protein
MSDNSTGHWLIEGVSDLLWPKRCVGCERLETLLCKSCEQKLMKIDHQLACKRCGAPYGHIVCTECFTTEGILPLSFSAATCACIFADTAARLIVIYKDQHEQRLAEICANLLLEAIQPQWLEWADMITYSPAEQEKVKSRGFDHMMLIAESLAGLTNLNVEQTLIKQGGSDQRDLNREQRLENLKGVIRCKSREHVSGRNILLLDDVLTTLATAQTAAEALMCAGAREVRVATVCRVY